MSARRQGGFNLIELMIVVGLIGALMIIGVPTFNVWIQNTQIRTAAEGILAGLQTAKNEAIRRNVPVQLMLTGDTGWQINLASDPGGTPLQTRAHDEGSYNATLLLQPPAASTVTFSGLGRVTTNADGTASLAQISIDNPRIPDINDRRLLNIIIPAGGAIRMCDPRVAVPDPRAC